MEEQLPECKVNSSHQVLPENQPSSPNSYISENQGTSFHSFWSQFESADTDQSSNSYVDGYEIDESALSYTASPNMRRHYNFDNGHLPHAHQRPTEPLAMCGDRLNPAEPFPPLQYNNGPYSLPAETGIPYEPADASVIPYGIPTVTNYRAVSILLRHLIRVDVTSNGSVIVYNFPSMSITALDASGRKFYIHHPNGRVFQDGPDVHMATVNSRYAKITHKGVVFSLNLQGLAYTVDESGTKTTSAKFMDLDKEVVMGVFYDGIPGLQEECNRMAAEARYISYPNCSELWAIGRFWIKQNKWGEVTVTQTNDTKRRKITVSPTRRSATVESSTVNVNIDCFSKNYLIVRKGSCSVTSGFCGLVVQNGTQKAGIDRLRRLVMF